MSIKSTITSILPEAIKKPIRKKMYENSYKQWLKEGKPLPPPHVVKQKAIVSFQNQFGYQTLVETGTYKGEMIDAQIDNFSKIISIELGKELFEMAKQKYADNKDISIINGDSGKELFKIVKDLDTNAIFWLDGHYSGGITALGDLECPIYGELEAILSDKLAKHVILIDDAHCFVGKNDYPTIDELKQYVLDFRPDYNCQVSNDIIRFTLEK